MITLTSLIDSKFDNKSRNFFLFKDDSHEIFINDIGTKEISTNSSFICILGKGPSFKDGNFIQIQFLLERIAKKIFFTGNNEFSEMKIELAILEVNTEFQNFLKNSNTHVNDFIEFEIFIYINKAVYLIQIGTGAIFLRRSTILEKIFRHVSIVHFLRLANPPDDFPRFSGGNEFSYFNSFSENNPLRFSIASLSPKELDVFLLSGSDCLNGVQDDYFNEILNKIGNKDFFSEIIKYYDDQGFYNDRSMIEIKINGQINFELEQNSNLDDLKYFRHEYPSGSPGATFLQDIFYWTIKKNNIFDAKNIIQSISDEKQYEFLLKELEKYK